MQIHIFKDEKETADALAKWITTKINLTLKIQSRFTIALSGGETPKLLYKELAAEHHDKIDWSKLHIFWGDERVVPFDDDRNNAKMAYETLLNKVSIPAEQIHVMRTDILPEESSKEYEKILHEYFDDTKTSFDLALLGMGKDGHTLSLFPNSPILQEQEKWVASVYSEEQKQYRITLLPAIVNKASSIVFFVTGSEKSKTLEQVMSNSKKFPVHLIQPKYGELHWFVDEAAAKP